MQLFAITNTIIHLHKSVVRLSAEHNNKTAREEELNPDPLAEILFKSCPGILPDFMSRQSALCNQSLGSYCDCAFDHAVHMRTGSTLWILPPHCHDFLLVLAQVCFTHT